MIRFWLISDTHFFHKEIIKWEGRKPNFEKEIIRKWNNTVKKDDYVYLLGDVSFWKADQLKPIMDQLNGKIILVRGNHDKKSFSYYINNGFLLAVDEIKLRDFYWKDIILSHIPLDSIPKGYINVHWHLHSANHREKGLYTKERGYYLYNPEKTGYNLMPVLLKNHIC